MIVNKAELAEVIKTSLPTIDKLIRRHGDRFPIVERGTNGREYKFEADAVLSFLNEREAEARAAGAERDDLMRQYTLPVENPDERGLTPSERLTLAKVRAAERHEQKEAGFLVSTAEVRARLTTAFTHLTRAIDTAIRQTCRDANIPEPTIRTMEARVNEAKRRAVAEIAVLMAEPGTAEDADQHTLLPN